MAQEDASVKLFAWRPGCQCEFTNGRQNAVLSGNLFTCGFATPERQKLCNGHGDVFAAPRDVDTDHGSFSLCNLWISQDSIDEVFKSTDVAGSCVILPAMDIDE